MEYVSRHMKNFFAEITQSVLVSYVFKFVHLEREGCRMLLLPREFHLPRRWRITVRFCSLRPFGVDIKFNIT